MSREHLLIITTVVAGGLVALQAPINSTLGRSVGTFAAASISFIVGTVVLVAITVTLGGGFGQVGQVQGLPWYYLIGGLLGAVYVTNALVSVRTLGAGGITAATITGQLLTAVAIDRFGVLGIPEKPLSIGRIAGVVLLVVGTYLIVRE
ncbi:MAG: bacterial/archaeal transporter family-2 protein [Thermoleophilaceae bacterium]|jgi:transporter family-2 protein|nr:bacterial/archaeal transporter family-2 protein [Thermoleophilaceae bacterium]